MCYTIADAKLYVKRERNFYAIFFGGKTGTDWMAAGPPVERIRSFPGPRRVCGGAAKPFLYLQNVSADVQNLYGDLKNVL
jgi:hypothetical protein